MIFGAAQKINKNQKICEKRFSAATVGGRGVLPEELLESAKSSRVMQSVQLDLGRPVPCEQGAADLWATSASADLRLLV